MKNNGFLKGVLTTIVVIIAIVVLAGIFNNPLDKKLDDVIDGLTGSKVSKITVVDITSKLSECAELSTCVSYYHVTVNEETWRTTFGETKLPFTRNDIELECDGIVYVAYDFEKIVAKVDDLNQKIYIDLPEPYIQSNDVLYNENMVFTEYNNPLNPIGSEEFKALMEAAEIAGEKDAIECGAFDEADAQIKSLITNFLGCFAGYTVEFI